MHALEEYLLDTFQGPVIDLLETILSLLKSDIIPATLSHGYVFFTGTTLVVPVAALPSGVIIEEKKNNLGSAIDWPSVFCGVVKRGGLLPLLWCLSNRDAGVCMEHTKEQARNILHTPPCVVDTLRYGRADIQTCMSAIYYRLFAKIGCRHRINSFYTALASYVWRVDSCSILMKQLRYIIHNAEIVALPTTCKDNARIVIDNSAFVKIPDRDARVLVLLFLYSLKYKPVPDTLLELKTHHLDFTH